MLDLIYIICIIGFFALMLAFVRGLEVLGRDAAARGLEVLGRDAAQQEPEDR